ncbi:MAG: hypothetical protein ACYCO3_13415, partial [Mycobacteriales bacterium]
AQVRAGHLEDSVLALAVDGKAVRGAVGADGRAIQLFAAMTHAEGSGPRPDRGRPQDQRDHRVPPASWSRRRARTSCSRSRRTSRPSPRRSGPWMRGLFPPAHTEYAKGHGRVERRSVATSTKLNDYLADPDNAGAFPHVAQVFRIEREVRNLDGSPRWTETAYGVTSLTPVKADPATVLAHNRLHWGIENKTHWVRSPGVRLSVVIPPLVTHVNVRA